MFYATRNTAIIGYKPEGIAFESKTKRDSFCGAKPSFNAVSATDAKKGMSKRVFEKMRKYPDGVFNEKGYLQGIALFDYNGKFIQYC